MRLPPPALPQTHLALRSIYEILRLSTAPFRITIALPHQPTPHIVCFLGASSRGALLPRPQRSLATRRLCILAAFIVVGYVVFLAWLSPATFPAAPAFHSRMPYLADKPFGEDGFYMLTVADNLATHGQLAYNRGLLTTGIQPLATFLFAGVDWWVHLFHGDAWDFIRWVLVFGALLLVLFAWQLARLAASLAPAIYADAAFALAFVLTLTDYTLFRLATYGLETGVYLCCLALCLECTRRILAAGRASLTHALLLGLAAGLAGLARIDFGLLLALLLAMLLFRRLISLANAALCGAIALLLVSPWLWFVHHVSGSWMPSSGRAEAALVTTTTFWPRLQVMFFTTAANIAPWSYGGLSPYARWETLISLAAIAGLCAWLSTSAQGRLVRAHASVAFRLASLWLPALALLPVIYLACFSSLWFYHRYTAPLLVITIPLLAVTLAAIPSIRAHLPSIAMLLACVFGVWTIGALHTGHLGNSHSVETGYVRANYPAAHVGAFQSGELGYFNRDVENLDGKMNPAALLAARQHRLPAFLDQQGVDVLVDWPSQIHRDLDPAYLLAEWQPCPLPITGSGSICLERRHASPLHQP